MEDNFTANTAEAVVTAEGSEILTEEAAPKKKQRKPINQQKLQDNLWGWAFCVPLIIGTIWFVYIAFILAVMLSFTSYTTGSKTSMFSVIGQLGNFIIKDTGSSATTAGAWHWYYYAFTNTAGTTSSLYSSGISVMNELGAYLFNTVFYMIGIPIGMVLAVFFAVCMSRDIKGGNLFRVLYYLPCVASSVAVVYTFRLLFKQQGVINKLFGMASNLYDGREGFRWVPVAPDIGMTWAGLTGSTSESAFMNDPFWCQGIISKCVIIIMSVWKGLGGTIILYAAGLSGVNASTKEAAQIDGANGWQIFWKVTMPDLYPVIFYNIVTSVIGGMQIYAEPEMLMDGMSMLTSGYVSLIYYYGMNTNWKYAGAASAYGMILAIMIFIMTLFQFWLDSRKSD